MKRILLGFALAAGALVAGITNASASTYCSLDPTVGVGTPVTYTVDVKLNGSNAHASGNDSSTTVSGGVALP